MDESRQSSKERRIKEVGYSSGWSAGFICAVCIMIRLEGQVTTQIRDLWKCDTMVISREKLVSMGIDESDIETLIANQSELN